MARLVVVCNSVITTYFTHRKVIPQDVFVDARMFAMRNADHVRISFCVVQQPDNFNAKSFNCDSYKYILYKCIMTILAH